MKIKDIDFRWLGHDCFRLQLGDTILYTDPYKIEEGEKADIILSSHEHDDHCHVPSLKKLCSKETTLVTTPLSKEKVKDFSCKKKYMTPGDSITVGDINIDAVHAYNTNKFRSPGKPYHPKGKKIGFILTINGTSVYFAGDTDVIDEMEDLGEIDIAMLPISGTYVMTVDEAVEAVKKINPEITIPMHVGKGIGSLEDTKEFKEKAGSHTVVKIVEME